MLSCHLLFRGAASSRHMNTYWHISKMRGTSKSSVHAELCVRLLQSEIMLEQGMVPDISTYRSVFCPEGGDAPWILDRAG
mgnify:CR=1 FL=1